MKVEGEVARHWRSRQEFMEETGIYMPDDTFVPLLIESVADRFRVFPGEIRSISPIFADYDWDMGARFCEARDSRHLAEAGEAASHGSVGFVALSARNESGDYDLKWLAVLSESNPFQHVWLKDGVVEAWSTAEFLWSFRLETPWDVVITPAPFDQYK